MKLILDRFLQEEGLKLDLNWMKLEVEPNEGDE